MPRLEHDQKELLTRKKGEWESLSPEELYKELVMSRKAQRGYEFKKKVDPNIIKLGKEIKQLTDENTSDEIKKKMLEIKQAKKEIKAIEEIASRIEEKNLKAREHNRDINFCKAEQETILNILRDKEEGGA